MKMLLQARFLSSVQHTFLVFSPILTKPTFRITVRSQKSSSESSDDDSAPKGFGLSDTATTANNKKKQKQKQKGQRERASVIRRTPLEKPAFVSEKQEGGKAKEEGKNESAFLLAMLGFGIVIFIEGIGLAASGTPFFKLNSSIIHSLFQTLNNCECVSSRFKVSDLIQ